MALRKESVDRNVSISDCSGGGLFMRISALILKIAIVKNSRIKKYKNIILTT